MASTRRKGITFEREIAKAFESAGFHVRGLEAGGDHLCIISRSGVGPSLGLPFYYPTTHVECKRHERLRLPEWIKQTERDAGELPWLLVYRQSRGRAYVVQPLEQYLGSTDA